MLLFPFAEFPPTHTNLHLHSHSEFILSHRGRGLTLLGSRPVVHDTIRDAQEAGSIIASNICRNVINKTYGYVWVGWGW